MWKECAPIRHVFRFLVLATWFGLVSGCLDVEEHYTLNPDGSGKVRFVLRKSADGFQISIGGQSLDGPEKLKEVVTAMLKESEGVAAWSDLRAEIDDDNDLVVGGVAYFRDLRKLRLKYGAVTVNGYEVVWQDRDDGRVELRIGAAAKPSAYGSSMTPAEPPSEERVAAEMAKQRRQYGQMRGMMEASLENLRVVKTFALPAGEEIEREALVAAEGGVLRYEKDGADLVQRLDDAMADETLFRLMAEESLTQHGRVEGRSASMTRFLDEDPHVIFAPTGEPQVAVEAEIAAAEAAFPAMMTALGFAREIPGLLPPASADGAVKIQLAGLQLVRDLELSSFSRPFNADPGLTLAFVARFGGRINTFEEARIDTAVDEQGRSLLPEHEHQRRVNFGQMNEPQDTVTFNLPLRLTAEASEVRRLTGTLIYTVANETETVPLGFAKIATEETGEVEGALIRRVGPAQWGEGYDLEVTLPFAKPLIKELRALRPSGVPWETTEGGSSWSNQQTIMTLRSPEPFPEDLNLVVELYTDQRRLQAPIRVEHLPIPRLP